MKILPTPIRKKMMPIVAASLLTAGTLSSCTMNNFNVSKEGHCKEIITTLNNDLNYLNSARKTGTIEFNDYYEKSKKIINETELNEEKLKEDNKICERGKNAMVFGLSAIVGLILLHILDFKAKDERLQKVPLPLAILFGLSSFGYNYIHKDLNEQKYIQEAQRTLKVYKDEKLATLDSLKIKELNKTPIKISENK